jgi:hypothetical protein
MTLAEDVAAALTAAGYSNLRAFRFDHSTASQICIIPFGGSQEKIFSTDGRGGSDIQRPRVQIQVRDADLATAEARANAIIALLHRGTVANCISVIWDGREKDYWQDDNSRHVFSIEFLVIRSAGLVG